MATEAKKNKTIPEKKAPVTVGDVATAYGILKKATVHKMENAEQFAVVRAMKALRPIAKEFEDFCNDMSEKLKPEDWDELQKKADVFKTLSNDEKVSVNRALIAYDRKVEEGCAEERKKEVEAGPYKRISEEALGRLIESNPNLTIGQIMILQDFLC